jgi:hypothetical protein
MTLVIKKNLLQYLQDDLDVSDASLQIALRQREQDPGPLPMILWKYGLITLEQLDQIYDWLASGQTNCEARANCEARV